MMVSPHGEVDDETSENTAASVCVAPWNPVLHEAAVVTAIVLAAGLLGMLGSLLVGRVVLPGNGFTATGGYPPPSLADEPTCGPVLGTDLYLGLLALFSLGVGTALRHTAAAITTVVAVLYVPAIVVQVVPFSPHLIETIEKYAPMTAGLAVQVTVEGADGAPIGPWAGLGVFAAYTAGALLLDCLLLNARDA
jgi:ABC-2 type transport system permease protein